MQHNPSKADKAHCKIVGEREACHGQSLLRNMQTNSCDQSVFHLLSIATHVPLLSMLTSTPSFQHKSYTCANQLTSCSLCTQRMGRMQHTDSFTCRELVRFSDLLCKCQGGCFGLVHGQMKCICDNWQPICVSMAWHCIALSLDWGRFKIRSHCVLWIAALLCGWLVRDCIRWMSRSGK